MIRLLDDRDLRPRPRPWLMFTIMLSAWVAIFAVGGTLKMYGAPWWISPLCGCFIAYSAARFYAWLLWRDKR